MLQTLLLPLVFFANSSKSLVEDPWCDSDRSPFLRAYIEKYQPNEKELPGRIKEVEVLQKASWKKFCSLSDSAKRSELLDFRGGEGKSDLSKAVTSCADQCAERYSNAQYKNMLDICQGSCGLVLNQLRMFTAGMDFEKLSARCPEVRVKPAALK